MSSRLERLGVAVSELGCDAVLVRGGADLRWLTGFTGTSGVAACGPDLAVFVTDSRYAEQAQRQLDEGVRIVIADGDPLEELARSLPGSGTIGFDPKAVTVDALRRFGRELGDGWEAREAVNPITRLRMVKEAREIAAITEASRIADEALGSVLAGGIVGRTEAEVAWALEVAVREGGGEGMAFPPIVAAGPNGALPHASPSGMVIEKGTLLVIDWGAVNDGFHSDCTRTFSTGSLTGVESEVHDVVLSAQQAALDALRPGPTGREIDSIAREVIEQACYGANFGHGLGHGVGLEIHKAPTLGKRNSDTAMEEGMVVTIEPGIYLPGSFGVRIEELCVVTADGHSRLTSRARGIVEVD